MATLRIPDQDITIQGYAEVKSKLADLGIGYEVWKPSYDIDRSADNSTILDAYAKEIEDLKAQGGYVAADVINIFPETPNLETMLAKFSKEHWHDEDEVRFITEGSGIFHIRSIENNQVYALTVEEGDLIRVPAGTWHWFDLCQERRIRAIRLFQDPSGWTPHYTESGVDKGYLPLCFGLSFIPAELQEL